MASSATCRRRFGSRRCGLTATCYEPAADCATLLLTLRVFNGGQERSWSHSSLRSWGHHHLAANPPAEFIPVAEESGLIVPLGSHVLDEACRHLAWLRRNLADAQDLYISVNLSPRQLWAGDVVDTVAAALRRYDLPGDALSLDAGVRRGDTNEEEECGSTTRTSPPPTATRVATS